jgi:hypothetical protein
MPYTPINFVDKFTRFSEHWSPRIIAQMNDYHFKLVKIQGEFVWHAHADTDEVFIAGRHDQYRRRAERLHGKGWSVGLK